MKTREKETIREPSSETEAKMPSDERPASHHNSRPAPLETVAGEDNYDRWRTFKESWADYALLEGIYTKSPAVQVASFRVALGENNRELLRNLQVGGIVPDDKADEEGASACKSLQTIFEVLNHRFARHENTIHRRYQFHKAAQTTGETVNDFFDRVIKLARLCRFDQSVANSLIRDQLVVGTNLSEARASIFKENVELTLEQVLLRLRLYEDNKRTLENIESGNTEETVNVIKKQRQQPTEQKPIEIIQDCRFCGTTHAFRKCPAFGTTCEKCQRRNHFKTVCRSSEQANQVANADDSSEEEYAWSVRTTGMKAKKRYFVSFATRRSGQLRAQIDTGATCNCMGRSTFERLRKLGHATQLDATQKIRVKMYDGSDAYSMGASTVSCGFNGKKLELPFLVFERKLETLLSGSWAEKIEAIEFHPSVKCTFVPENCEKPSYSELLEEYKDNYHGLGKFSRVAKLELNPSISPRQQTPGKTPAAIPEARISRIRPLEQVGIIEKVEKPTPWNSNLSKTSIRFLGHIASDESVKPDPEKTVKELSGGNTKELPRLSTGKIMFGYSLSDVKNYVKESMSRMLKVIDGRTEFR